ncbi:hypothetical protein NE237_009135 [Protea cynaroides]|uniref:MBD domain-containing protein n=1 Tax=Protea cynaroides TaxID=273540 RepID=A0A9Q0R003_9MAGN|nr:hypothetical protein NE237_009135 [Protea cynaroides]
MSASKIPEKELNPSSHEPTESDLLARTIYGAPLDLGFEFVADDAAHIDDGNSRIKPAIGEFGIETPLNEVAIGETDGGNPQIKDAIGEFEIETPLNEAAMGETDDENPRIKAAVGEFGIETSLNEAAMDVTNVGRAPDEDPRTTAEPSPLPPPPPSSEVDDPFRNGARDLEVGLEANSLDAGNFGSPVSVMEKVEPQLKSQGRPRGRRGAGKTGLELAMVETSPKTPDWLPPGWLMENRIRTTGVTAGLKDRYFYDPVSGRQFRSKKEVLCFIETGSSGRYRSGSKKSNTDANIMALESSGGDRQNGSNLKGKRSNASRFNFNNRPSKVRWVLTDSANGLWTPFIGDESLPESSKQEWATAFTSSALCNGRSPIF